MGLAWLSLFLKLPVHRLDKEIDIPKYSRFNDAAFDLRAGEEVVIEPGTHVAVKTGIRLAIPEGHVGLIWDRSGLAAKHRVTTLAGVIDSNYRGEVGVVLCNLGETPFTIEKGMRIAQMIIQPFVAADIEEVEDLDDTNRGDGAWGSSGMH